MNESGMDSNAKVYGCGRLPAHITCDNQYRKKLNKYLHGNILYIYVMGCYICTSVVIRSSVR